MKRSADKPSQSSGSIRKGLYGSYLSQHNEVTMLDVYEPQVQALNENGITVLEENGEERHFRDIRAMKSGTCTDAADLMIVFVKSNYTSSALEENKALFGPDTIVMTLQNGAGNDRKIAQYVQPQNVVIGTSKHNSVNLGGGKIRHSGTGVTTIGSNHGRPEALGTICSLLNESGFRAEISDDTKFSYMEVLNMVHHVCEDAGKGYSSCP